jgi:homoserine dehydrogenase
LSALKKISTALFGLGTVNIGLLKILAHKWEYIKTAHGIEFIVTAVADSSGIAFNKNGFAYKQLIDLKSSKEKVSSLAGYQKDAPLESIVGHTEAKLLIESSPGNLNTGEPGLKLSKVALAMGCSVVFANKVPLVFAFDELHQVARQHGSKLAYSATVCGGLPVINVLQRDLKATSLKNLRGILNATTNYILNELENGGTMAEAVKEAQRLGAAEADPSHDLNGHDTANKLFIIMKSFTNYTGSIHDIEVTGIQSVTRQQCLEALAKGNKIKLMAEAKQVENTWKLSVKPVEVNADSFFGTCQSWEMGIELTTDLYESISMKNYEADPVGTSAAVLRDAIRLCE